MDIFGEFEHQVDDKGRVTLPAKLRPYLEAGSFLTRGWDGSIFLFPKQKWDEFQDKLNATRLTDMEALAVRRFMSGSAADGQMDRQGRVFLPPKLREFAHVKKDVVIRGMGDWIEIWDKSSWEEYDQAELTPDKITEKARTLGL